MKAYRYWNESNPCFYVAQVKGDGGKDWGYTDKASKAIDLSPYWMKRFSSDCRFVGTEAKFI